MKELMKKVTAKDVGILLFAFILGCIFIIVLYFCIKPLNKKELRLKQIELAKPVCDSIKVTVTVFNPTVEQCGKGKLAYTCADGSIINPKNPQRWCGASRELVQLIGYGNNITLHIPQAPYLNGEWKLHTTSKKSLRSHVDLLISNPTVCNVRGKWTGYIIFFK
jgi:hypothetical protein